MSTALLLFPDLALILLGCALRRMSGPGRPLGGAFPVEVWEGAEKLVYFVLFPALLFTASVRSRLDVGTTLPMLGVALAVVFACLAAIWLARLAIRPDARDFVSVQQCAFRFNTYIGLALAQRLAGDDGVARLALIVGFAVPLCNALAVLPLARHAGGGVLRQLARNPLLVATLAGLAGNLAGLQLPEPVQAVLTRLGQASVALGLMTVGAGLGLAGAAGARALLTATTATKLVLAPALALVAGRAVGLDAGALSTVVLFGALPTASSAYILAMRMGGNGPLVAAAITLSTLGSMATLPVWVTLAH